MSRARAGWAFLALTGSLGGSLASAIVTAAPAAAASTIVVTTTADTPSPPVGASLRSAITTANAASEPVTIVLATGGTYELNRCGGPPVVVDEHLNDSGDLDLTGTAAITIEGNGAVIRQTCGGERVLDLRVAPQAVVLRAVTITGGAAAQFGAAVRSVAALTLDQVTVSGNNGNTLSPDAAVATSGPSPVTIVDSSISDNVKLGGLWDRGAGSPVTIDRSTIARNGVAVPASNGYGKGGISIEGRTLAISDSSVVGNVGLADFNAGGITAIGAATRVDADRVEITDNAGAKGGGAFGTNLRIRRSFVARNMGYLGGGLAGTVDVADSVIAFNDGGLVGGGIEGDGTIARTTVVGNRANYGGGLSSGSGPFVVRDSTITGNSAVLAGGGVIIYSSGDIVGSLELRNSTVVDNSAGNPLGQDLAGNTRGTAVPGPFDISGSIIGSSVAHGESTTNCSLPAAWTWTASGPNLSSDGSCGFGTGANATTVADDLRLGPLQANGGLTLTRMPSLGSAALDVVPAVTSACSGTDQRGTDRPQGGSCDLGAVERALDGYHPAPSSRIGDTRTGVGGPAMPVQATDTSPRQLHIGGAVGSTTAGAEGVVVNVTVTNATTDSHLTVWPSGTPMPNASSINFLAGETRANLVTVRLGVDGSISYRTNAGAADVIVDVVGWYDDGTAGVGLPASPCPCGSAFVPIAPNRVADSRTGTGIGQGPLPLAGTTETQVAPVPGVPVNATAVAVNLTVTDGSADGFLTAYPTNSGAPPATSSVNWKAGQTASNLAIVPLITNQGTQSPKPGILLRGNAGTFHVILDVVGYFVADGPLPPSSGRAAVQSPQRIFDTRASTPLGPGEVRTFTVAPGTKSVALNVTATQASADTHLTVYPGGQPLPATSALNIVPGRALANMVLVGVGEDGTVQVRNNSGNVHAIVDLAAIYR